MLLDPKPAGEAEAATEFTAQGEGAIEEETLSSTRILPVGVPPRTLAPLLAVPLLAVL